MMDPIERAVLFALYQVSIVLGIVMLPVALLVRRGGLTLPVHRIIERVEHAYAER